MSPNEVVSMPSHEIVELLQDLRPSDEAAAWLSALIADPAMVEGVSELARRYAASHVGGSFEGRARSADSVLISGPKFKHAMWKRRIPLSEVGPLIGRSVGLGSVLAHKGRINYYTCDELARAIGVHVDALVAEICADEELERLTV